MSEAIISMLNLHTEEITFLIKWKSYGNDMMTEQMLTLVMTFWLEADSKQTVCYVVFSILFVRYSYVS